MAISLFIPNKPQASGINNKEPPATPDAPHADIEATIDNNIAVPKSTKYSNIKDLEGKRIATSYPKTVQDFLDKNGVNANLHIINGSVEIAPNIGLADAICDIVSSGSTLFKNSRTT